MSTLAATDPTADEWVDIRMTDPGAGEWELDAVVVDGRMEHVDLRVREDLVASFVECLADDLSASQRAALLDRLADDGDGGDDADGDEPGED
ncbi:hypothetical protein [Halorientalis sp. IM1011]|uniref:hypothetical protein n=1 Tax=Halorientalis sp. IM1011 TaxID=1932360 RepID=UPI0009FD232A|nr:hypothetical protein [Halorientalis sp. IM1011]